MKVKAIEWKGDTLYLTTTDTIKTVDGDENIVVTIEGADAFSLMFMGAWNDAIDPVAMDNQDFDDAMHGRGVYEGT